MKRMRDFNSSISKLEGEVLIWDVEFVFHVQTDEIFFHELS